MSPCARTETARPVQYPPTHVCAPTPATCCWDPVALLAAAVEYMCRVVFYGAVRTMRGMGYPEHQFVLYRGGALQQICSRAGQRKDGQTDRCSRHDVKWSGWWKPPHSALPTGTPSFEGAFMRGKHGALIGFERKSGMGTDMSLGGRRRRRRHLAGCMTGHSRPGGAAQAIRR